MDCAIIFQRRTCWKSFKLVSQILCVNSRKKVSSMATDSGSFDHSAGRQKLVEHFNTIRNNMSATKKRKLLKEGKRERLANSVLQFKVISTGYNNSCKSVILQTEFLSYMFNCGDGILRQCGDNNGSWTKLEHIFVTQMSYKNLAGTLELSMGLADPSSISHLNIHGLGSLACLIDCPARTFGKGAVKSLVQQPANQSYKDRALIAEPVRLSDQTNPSSDAMAACAFKLTFPAPKRKVNTENLMKYCVKPGPWLKQLIDTNGSVEVSGKTITADMVLDEQRKSQSALVIDCPSVNHLPGLSEHRDRLSKISEGDSFVDLIIHMSPDHVTHHPKYQEFVSLFPSSTVQIMLLESKEVVNLNYAWDQQVHLNLIEPNMFPHLYPKPDISSEKLVTEKAQTEVVDGTDSQEQGESSPEIERDGDVYIARPGLQYNLVKGQMVTRYCRHKSTVESGLEYFSDTQREEVLAAIASRQTHTDNNARDYPIVTMLGTGAAMSSRTRNTAGILVELSKDNFALLDCGYGVLSQLTSLYGRDHSEHILKNLKQIFISHGHADHHGGLLAVLCARKAACESPPPQLHIILPGKLRKWCQHLGRNFDNCMDNVRMLGCDQLCKDSQVIESYKLSNVELKQTFADIQVASLETVRVQHAYGLQSFGICVRHSDYKLVYSGDTMPCDRLVEAAMHADLLIHEATFADSFIKDAEMKTHCTTSQALDVAKRSQAKFTLLTHFSTRHPRMAGYSVELHKAENVGIAFDNMILRPKDLPNTTLSSLHDILRLMYPLHVTAQSERSRTIANKREQGMDPLEIIKSINESVELEQSLVKKRKLRPSEEVDAANGPSQSDSQPHESVG